jgi:hypothetical protein
MGDSTDGAGNGWPAAGADAVGKNAREAPMRKSKARSGDKPQRAANARIGGRAAKPGGTTSNGVTADPLVPQFCDYHCPHADFPPAETAGICRTMSAVLCTRLQALVNKNATCEWRRRHGLRYPAVPASK